MPEEFFGPGDPYERNLPDHTEEVMPEFPYSSWEKRTGFDRSKLMQLVSEVDEYKVDLAGFEDRLARAGSEEERRALSLIREFLSREIWTN